MSVDIRRALRTEDTGASALLVAMSMVVILGIAALAIDIANGFNERRQDQTAADIGVMAGAWEGGIGTREEVRDEILDFSRRNVVDTYTNADWADRWMACTDPERLTLNAGSFNFIPVPTPAGWAPSDGVTPAPTRLDCISIDPGGFVRVNLPDLEFSTTFGKIFGVSELRTNADAIARIRTHGRGGLLPFGLWSGTGDGEHACLRTAPNPLAQEPCVGSSDGNFGVINSPHYGSVPGGPARDCTPDAGTLEVNISFGIDHLLTIDRDGILTSVFDTCAVMDSGLTPDTMRTRTGGGVGVEEGLVGPESNTQGFVPRLQQGPNTKRTVYGRNLDDKPLWEYIDPALVFGAPGVDIPASCERSSFNSGLPAFDWDGDGTPDAPDSWQHMAACLQDYADGTLPGHPQPYTTQLFLETVEESPRFSYVPQFYESFPGAGVSADQHIAYYKATWLQGTWFQRGATIEVFHPGEPGTFSGSVQQWRFVQVSSIVIPDLTLVDRLRGTSAFGGLNPFTPELWR